MANVEFPGGDWDLSALGPDVDAATVDDVISRLGSDTATFGSTLSLVIVRGGRIVREHHGAGISPASTLISWSMAKSITHALVGIAVGDGLLDTSMSSLFDEWSGDERASISLGNLLNMSSGLEWVEDYVDGTVSDVIEMLYGDSGFAGDHAAYAIAKNLEARPGSKYKYSSGTTNIVARVLARALGESAGSSVVVEDFMRRRLFAPIGMNSAVPKFDASGNFVGSSYVYATARDFARFGWLYRNDGVWNGERILPRGWVDHGRTPVALDPENGFHYGGHWWIHPSDPGSMAALGYEGQFTWVSPRRDVVLVRMGRSDANQAPLVKDELVRIIGAFPVVDDNGGRHE